MKKILIIPGSFRRNSFNTKIALYTKTLLEDNFYTEVLEYESLPFMNQDLEENLPDVVKNIKESVMKADALWFFTPEYNQSYPGAVKNLIDWLSRPLVYGNYASGTAIKGKVVAITSAGGKNAGRGSIDKLTQLLNAVKAKPLECSVGIALSPECFMKDTLILTKEDEARIQEEVKILNNLLLPNT